MWIFEHTIFGIFLRSTHPARASRPVKIHVGEIKIIRSTGGTHLGDKSRILDNVRAFGVRCGLRFVLRPLSLRYCVFLSLRAFLR